MSSQSQYTLTSEPTAITASMLGALYESVGFGIAQDYTLKPDTLKMLTAPGVFFFAAMTPDLQLIGLVRALSDDHCTTWIAELLVDPRHSRKGIGKNLLAALIKRFAHTSIYAEAMNGSESILQSEGLTVKPQLIACSRGAKPFSR